MFGLGGLSEDVGDVSGDLLEDLGCLCFSKEACGEVIQGVLPHDYHVWV